MILEIGATRMLVCPTEGASIGSGEALDLIADAIGPGAGGPDILADQGHQVHQERRKVPTSGCPW
jgi:hypothetical protein